MGTVDNIEAQYKGISVTKWFKAKVKPKHHGWYEVQFAGRLSTVMFYWTGRRWMFEVKKSKGRTGLSPSFSFGLSKGDKWRGLSVEYTEALEHAQVLHTSATDPFAMAG